MQKNFRTPEKKRDPRHPIGTYFWDNTEGETGRMSGGHNFGTKIANRDTISGHDPQPYSWVISKYVQNGHFWSLVAESGWGVRMSLWCHITDSPSLQETPMSSHVTPPPTSNPAFSNYSTLAGQPYSSYWPTLICHIFYN